MKKHPALQPAKLVTLLALLFTSFLPLQAATTLKISTPQLKPESKIEIIFDRAVVSDDQVNTTAPNSIITIEPALNGTLHWRAANIATFIASEAPKMGKQYTFSLNKGLVDRDGKALPATKLKTIQAEPRSQSETCHVG